MPAHRRRHLAVHRLLPRLRGEGRGEGCPLSSPDRDLLQHLDRLPDERRDVAWLARGHEVLIDDDLLVDDVGTDLREVILDRDPGRQLASLDDPRGYQQLRPVADRQHRLVGVEERLGEFDHPRIRPEVVRRVATWDEQRIELLGADLIDTGLGFRRDLALLAFQLFARLQADDRDLVTLVFECVVGLFELRILVINIEYTGNPHSDTSLCVFADTGRPAYPGPSAAVKLVLGR